jgi:uncharacterized protein Smg (DUF494 family)
MKNNSIELMNGIKVFAYHVITLRHQDKRKIDGLLSKITRMGIKHLVIKDIDHCLKNGCLKKTGMHIPKNNGKTLVSIRVYDEDSLEKLKTLILGEMTHQEELFPEADLREKILTEETLKEN